MPASLSCRTVMFIELLSAWFALTLLLPIWLGFQQTPADRDEEQQVWFGTAAVAVFIADALLVLVFLSGSGWFVLGAFWLAFCLLCHHAVIHRNSRFDGEQCSCSWFQCSDVRNHETWIVAAVTAGLVSALRV